MNHRIAGRLTLLWLALSALGSNDFSEQAFECESAAAHLFDCCPEAYIPENACWHDTESCADGPVPVFSTHTSQCLQERSCDELRANVCPELTPELYMDGDWPLLEVGPC